jgi:hypothetical protein
MICFDEDKDVKEKKKKIGYDRMLNMEEIQRLSSYENS